ncbi:MAG: hypothetical protein WC455_13710 [Dehalococcoidia bacterium]|jgi:membrane protein YdbS with pleckstrin-like domain
MARRGRWSIVVPAVAIILCLIIAVDALWKHNMGGGLVMLVAAAVNVWAIVSIWRHTRD